MYVRSLDPSVLAFILSLYRHPSICILVTSRFTSYNKQQKRIMCLEYRSDVTSQRNLSIKREEGIQVSSTVHELFMNMFQKLTQLEQNLNKWIRTSSWTKLEQNLNNWIWTGFGHSINRSWTYSLDFIRIWSQIHNILITKFSVHFLVARVIRVTK